MPLPQYRIFFDTSTYLAALLSPSGAAGELMRLAEAGAIRMVVSEEVVKEADRVLTTKFPELIQENRRLWKALAPEVVSNPQQNQMKPFLERLPEGDAAILCAAHLAGIAAFVTWNTHDFMTHRVQSLVDFPIVVPGEMLKLFRKWINPLLD